MRAIKVLEKIDGKIVANPEALRILRQKFCGVVYVIAFVGDARTGKTTRLLLTAKYLMGLSNAGWPRPEPDRGDWDTPRPGVTDRLCDWVRGARHGDLPQAGPSEAPVTRGCEMLDTPIPHPSGIGSFLLLDVEGSGRGDMKMVVRAMAVACVAASTLVYCVEASLSNEHLTDISRVAKVLGTASVAGEEEDVGGQGDQGDLDDGIDDEVVRDEEQGAMGKAVEVTLKAADLVVLSRDISSMWLVKEKVATRGPNRTVACDPYSDEVRAALDALLMANLAEVPGNSDRLNDVRRLILNFFRSHRYAITRVPDDSIEPHGDGELLQTGPDRPLPALNDSGVSTFAESIRAVMERIVSGCRANYAGGAGIASAVERVAATANMAQIDLPTVIFHVQITQIDAIVDRCVASFEEIVTPAIGGAQDSFNEARNRATAAAESAFDRESGSVSLLPVVEACGRGKLSARVTVALERATAAHVASLAADLERRIAEAGEREAEAEGEIERLRESVEAARGDAERAREAAERAAEALRLQREAVERAEEKLEEERKKRKRPWWQCSVL